jgi:hypothetical protein
VISAFPTLTDVRAALEGEQSETVDLLPELVAVLTRFGKE